MSTATSNGRSGVNDAIESIQSDNNHKDGHDERGRFAACNKIGLGSSFARRAGELRRMVQESVSPEDLRAIVSVLVDKAKGGDLQAAKVVLAYTVGKPQPAAEPDRATTDEAVLLKEQGDAGMALGRTMEPERIPEVLSATLYGFDEAVQATEQRWAQEEAAAGEQADDEPEPEEPGVAGRSAEQWQRLFAALPAVELRRIARWASNAASAPRNPEVTARQPAKPPR
jgi:hypothetical protein